MLLDPGVMLVAETKEPVSFINVRLLKLAKDTCPVVGPFFSIAGHSVAGYGLLRFAEEIMWGFGFPYYACGVHTKNEEMRVMINKYGGEAYASDSDYDYYIIRLKRLQKDAKNG